MASAVQLPHKQRFNLSPVSSRSWHTGTHTVSHWPGGPAQGNPQHAELGSFLSVFKHALNRAVSFPKSTLFRGC